MNSGDLHKIPKVLCDVMKNYIPTVRAAATRIYIISILCDTALNLCCVKQGVVPVLKRWRIEI